jgi:hypothetical protein
MEGHLMVVVAVVFVAVFYAGVVILSLREIDEARDQAAHEEQLDAMWADE